ncbi:DUF1648 domain-containing protein [Lacticaseibacillus parakribbianus]|uniref:DUF1648 domain-containing protein n=1 Tax=Lacticaseibacillus parakribbianus TaxID=2970927 RepID=UPI0021CB5696|nr:DUF1648 domain-containing protein [Lacticaseibacillus parakribbianus]
MRQLRMWLWGLAVASLAATALLMAVAPATIVMHFGAHGPDSFGPRWGLLLEPAVVAVLALACDWVAATRRRRAGLGSDFGPLVGEWRLIALVGAATVALALQQLSQCGWL